MSIFISFLIFLVGVALGGVAVYFVFRGRMSGQAQMVDAFKALASDTLHQNSAAFLQMAEGKLEQREEAAKATLDKKTVAIDSMIKPVHETLHRMDKQLKDLEVKREGAYRELAEMVTSSREAQTQLRQETSKLLQALRAPTGRGRWGELQLQRILEMTGMSAHAKDFSTQVTIEGQDEAGKTKTFRPDCIVNLPNGRCIIIDSKVSLTAYLDSVQSDDEDNDKLISLHAKQVKEHIKTLSNKAYWSKIESTPEFVVLFLPGEHFLSAALDGDQSLMEYSINQKVVLATPMTLIALLRAVDYGWRQEAMRENVLEMAEVGRKLYGALNTFSDHMGKTGKRLSSVVDAFNGMVGSYDRTVMSKARKFTEAGFLGIESDLAAPEVIDKTPRIVGNEDLLDKKEA